MQLRNVTVPVPDSVAAILHHASKDQKISTSSLLRPVLIRVAEKLAQHYGVTLDTETPNQSNRSYRMPADAGHPVGVSTTLPGEIYCAMRAEASARGVSLQRLLRDAAMVATGFDPVTFEDKRTPAQKRQATLDMRNHPDKYELGMRHVKATLNPEQVD